MLSKIYLVVVVAALVLTATATANAADRAVAEMRDQTGQRVGTVTLMQTSNGTLLYANFDRLSPGVHAFHVHGIGNCKPPFKSAGPHFFNVPGEKHGLIDETQPHAGDLPNIYVPATGNLELEVLAPNVSLNETVFDNDGSALVVHEGPDDYRTDPAGAAGPRTACGIIHR
jgi:Cu-Zn family superoxide dismutase